MCTGNICRSPIAEAIFRKRFSELGREDIGVFSMGIYGLDSHAASDFAVKVCSEHGIDISGHKSSPLVPSILKSSDMIFTMELDQKEFLLTFFPQVADKVFLLAAWPGNEKRKNDIKDPIGASIRVYRKVFDTIQFHIERIMPSLLICLPRNMD